ncbi:hypothetical protein C8Q77DRAFT_1137681 [Trametes polyzona]|nr:hypothetical protein C8Q77DRAFT_1137681 [Trametes polyzona]
MMDGGRKVEEGAGGVEKGKDERQSRQPSSDSVRTRAPGHTARPARHCQCPSPTPTTRPPANALSPAIPRRRPCPPRRPRLVQRARDPLLVVHSSLTAVPGDARRAAAAVAAHAPPISISQLRAAQRESVACPSSNPSTALPLPSPTTRPATCAAPAQRSARPSRLFARRPPRLGHASRRSVTSFSQPPHSTRAILDALPAVDHHHQLSANDLPQRSPSAAHAAHVAARRPRGARGRSITRLL